MSIVFSSCASEVRNDILRKRTSIDFDWKFIQQDVKNAAAANFDDSSWRTLNVPHDWSIEGTYAEDNPAGIAGAYLPTGIGWYRKKLSIENLQDHEKYFVEFDGVYMNSDVYINGHHLGNRPYGYISFSYDITPYLQSGKNILAVRVDHSKAPSGRWYTGSGINRHVWLSKTSKTYIPQYGVKVTTPEVSEKLVKIVLDISVENEVASIKDITIKSSVINADNQIVASKSSELSIGDSKNLQQEITLENPALWSPNSPAMYTIQTKLLVDGAEVDAYKTPFGIRSIELRGAKGFFLNGKSIKFKGLSNHHDAGPVGAAVPNDVLYHRLKMVKEMGCNALRTTHNPFAPEFYTMCDTLGIMVMDEAFDGWWTPKAKFDYGNYFDKWWKTDLKDFIKRDQNHPSVVIWSIGNEVRGFTAEQQKEIIDYAKTIDATRPYTQGRGYSAPHIDIAGFNGHGEYRGGLEKFHKKNPNKPIIGTEITHTLQTRGIYRTQTWYRTKDNPAPWEKPAQFKKMEPKVFKIPNLSDEEVFPGVTKKYQSSYDNSIVRIGVRDEWKRVEQYDYYMGNFRWTGFDYLGESFGWPARTANFGIIDLAGFPKDHYYLYQSIWSDQPMVHILPHWTHSGKEGMKIPVVVYTNCESAELFLNGKSLGEKPMTAEKQLVWQVPYTKGTLKVVAKNKGKIVAEIKCTTASKAAKIGLKTNRTMLQANQTDVVRVEVAISDANGNFVPTANNTVNFKVSGPAKIIGVENGDILDMNPHKVNYRNAFNGKCLLILQTTDISGEIEITATSEGLQEETIRISSVE